MKNSFKTIICAIAFSALFAFNASADDKEAKKVTAFGTGIFASKEGKVFVSIDKYNASPTIVMLEDAKGNVVYKEVMGKNEKKFRRTMDVSQLPSGSYTIQISSEGQKQTKTFDLTEKTAERVITLN
jgi:hypothetical protein